MRALNVKSTMYLYSEVQKYKTASENDSALHLLVFILLSFLLTLTTIWVKGLYRLYYDAHMLTLNISYSFYVIKYKPSNIYGFNLMLNPTVYTYVFNFQLLFP